MSPASPLAASVPAAGSTRRRILEVTAGLFARHGYAGTSMRDIALAVGIKPASLYSHFAAKDLLAREVLTTGIDHVTAAVRAAIDALPPDATHRERIRVACHAHLDVLLEESVFTSAHIRCFQLVPDEIRVSLADARRRHEALFRSLIEAAVADGALTPGLDPDMARLILLGTLNWTLEWRGAALNRREQLAEALAVAVTEH